MEGVSSAAGSERLGKAQELLAWCREPEECGVD